jgi:hypothetical protein
VVLLIGIHVGLLAYAAMRQSPTALEPALLASGVGYWQSGRAELYRVNPPLVRMVAAIPLLVMGCRTDWTELVYTHGPRPEYAIGHDFVTANGERSLWLMTVARWACIPFSVVGAIACFLWARALYKSLGAAVLAMAFWCLDPNILAHGGLITNDCAAAALGTAAGYALWGWLRSPSCLRALTAGAFLGVAILAKMTWIVLLALSPALAVAWWLGPGKRRACPAFVVQLALVPVTAIYCINLAYGFDGCFKQWRGLSLVSETLGCSCSEGMGNRTCASWLTRVPIPLPEQFVLGLDLQILDLEHAGNPSYLRGTWRSRGWWYYYLYGLLVKAPHGTQLLLVLVVCARLRRPLLESAWGEFVLLAPAISVFLVASANTAFNHHFRYVLPCYGFGFVFLGQAANLFAHCGTVWRLVPCALLACTVSSSLWTYPHVLAYFNEAAGGARNGHKQMLHSSLDWGQDLLYLRRWLAQHPEARPLQMAYAGGFDAQAIGMPYAHPPLASGRERTATGNCDQPGPLPGWYALSVNNVWCLSRRYQYFHRFEPVAMAGYSVYIYHITLDEANRVRNELGLREVTGE